MFAHFFERGRRHTNLLKPAAIRSDGYMTEWSGDDARLLAGLVLLRVGDVRDRLALECVSRGWRGAVRAAGNKWQGGY